jgi:endonuclease YncB( thermonuclease family)
MGWKTWDAYEREAHKCRRSLPWHKRYNWAAIAALVLVALIVLLLKARAEDLVGVPYIIDGDTVAIHGTKVRLQGIDAPEMEQFCLDDKTHVAECGKGVRDRLIEKSAGRPWTCHVSGQDRFKRSLARCYIAGEDIQRWMVRYGFALAYKQYSHDYDADEQAAREAHAGLWSGAFIAPWDWRHRNKSTEVLGAVSVPIDAQKLLLRPYTSSEPGPARSPSPTPTVHKARRGCGSRGGPGYRLSNGKCASWRHKRRSH